MSSGRTSARRSRLHRRAGGPPCPSVKTKIALNAGGRLGSSRRARCGAAGQDGRHEGAADAVPGDVPAVRPAAEPVRADAVSGELAAGAASAEASATRVDGPEADAVLGDVPPMVPGAEQVRADAVTDEFAAGEVIAKA